jgi:hypothetical protein
MFLGWKQSNFFKKDKLYLKCFEVDGGVAKPG